MDATMFHRSLNTHFLSLLLIKRIIKGPASTIWELRKVLYESAASIQSLCITNKSRSPISPQPE